MLVDSVATYTCKEGYEGITTPVERTCLSTGEWSDDAPACTPIPSGENMLQNQNETNCIFDSYVTDTYNFIL